MDRNISITHNWHICFYNKYMKSMFKALIYNVLALHTLWLCSTFLFIKNSVEKIQA